MEHRPQAEVGFQAAEHRLKVGQHRIGAPQRSVIPRGFIAAQAVDTRVRQLGPLDRGLLPGDGGGIQARLIGNDGDLVVLADPAGLFFQPPDALLDGRDGLLGVGFAQAVSEFGQTCLELLDQACADRGLLGLAAAD